MPIKKLRKFASKITFMSSTSNAQKTAQALLNQINNDETIKNFLGGIIQYETYKKGNNENFRLLKQGSQENLKKHLKDEINTGNLENLDKKTQKKVMELIKHYGSKLGIDTSRLQSSEKLQNK